MMKDINTIRIADDTYADINVIFQMMPNNMLEKINKKFVDFIKNQASETRGISNINPYIPIREQKLSKETETILALLYYSYFEEKENKNIIIFNNEKDVKSEMKEQKSNAKNILLVNKKKENVFMNILNYLKKWFK